MQKVEQLYDASYCARNKKKAWRYEVVPRVVEMLFDYFKPCSVIDFGCANGLHLANFKDLGAECFGVEGTLHYRQYIEENYDGEYAILDLRIAFDLRKRFELAICIDVLEHIEEEFAQTAVDNISRHADILCITASPVTNARYHPNGRKKDYWVKKFELSGKFEFKKGETARLQDKFKHLEGCPTRMKENLMIFRRKV